MRIGIVITALILGCPALAQENPKSRTPDVSKQALGLNGSNVDLGVTIQSIERRMSAMERATESSFIQREIRRSLEDLRLVQQALGGPITVGVRPQPCQERTARLEPLMKAEVIDLENALLTASNDQSRTMIWSLAMRNNGFRVSQLKGLVKAFQSDDARSNALALAYARTVDPEKFYETLTLLKSQTAQESLLNQIDGAQMP